VLLDLGAGMALACGVLEELFDTVGDCWAGSGVVMETEVPGRRYLYTLDIRILVELAGRNSL
jgi:hypothetical protein